MNAGVCVGVCVFGYSVFVLDLAFVLVLVLVLSYGFGFVSNLFVLFC